jgi:hypothetical protein
MRRRNRDQTPGAVVIRAYLAANRGRYADANREVAPDFATQLESSSASLKESITLLSKFRRLPNREGPDLGDLAGILKRCADPNFCWKVTTRHGSIQSIEIVKQRIRDDRATVVVTLQLNDGSVVNEKETLVWNGERWLIG